MNTYCLAIDIGASSGRHVVGFYDGENLLTEEVYRFKNGVTNLDGHLVWDVEYLFEQVKLGIKKAVEKFGTIKSLAIDTWGVDYVLFNGDKAILPCFSYRDGRTTGAIEKVHAKIPFANLYEKTGIQFQPFNTIYQLYDDMERGRLANATDFLMIPEYLSYRLTGVKAHEYTNATTTGLLNAVSKEYDGEIIQKLGLPKELFKLPIKNSGAAVGFLKPEIVGEVGANVQVVLAPTHDTASAVEGIPMDGNSPYISSGTWSLLGIKTDKAICDEKSREANYSNEGGIGYIRYQKNIMGMWVVNRLKEELCPEKSFSEITDEAEHSDFDLFTDIDDERFLSPVSMKKAFDECFASSNRKPQTIGDYFRCALLSLANGYKTALKELESNTGKTFDALYIVGGGAKNQLLNKFTEDVCKLKVIALPIEATSLGNLKIQLKR